MNSRVINDKQQKYPLWLAVLFTVVLLISALSIGAIAYKKWNEDPKQILEQSELVAQQQAILNQADVINTNWLRTLDPLVKKVEGRVVWSNTLQKGIMEFVDLPKIKDNQSYQLWISDLIGEDSKPIFSTQFNHVKKGDYLIPFSAKQTIQSPFKFELLLKTEGEEISQPLFLAQP